MSLKKYFGAVKFNDEKTIQLGCADAETLMSRLVGERRNFKETIHSTFFASHEDKAHLDDMMRGKSIDDSKDEYAGLNEHQIWAREWAKNHPDLLTPIEEVESPVPGVSIEYIIERQASPIYERWAMLSIHPEKRVGVPQSLIDEARLAWEQHAPEIAHYLPQWVD